MKVKSVLVARGFKKREETAFGETFAPTVSSSSVRLLIAIACELEFGVDQAFVKTHLDEDGFLLMPGGCGNL